MKSLLTLCFVLLLAACGHVPYTGRNQLLLLGEDQEVQMGLSAYQDTLKKETISTDPKLNEWVTRIGRRIANATGKTDYDWEFKVIDNDEVVNAFCLPGGKVAVYTGILPLAKDDSGLATIIGHEVAHAIARHGAERVSQQLAVEGLVAATALALVLSEQDSNKASLYAGLLGIGATLGVLLPYSRLHESEADQLGLIFMAKAGYDPRKARDFWVRMAEASKDESKSFDLLSTHPADETRIRNIDMHTAEALNYFRSPGAR